MESYVWLLAISKNPRIQHGPISLESQRVGEEGRVEEDDLTRDRELRHLQGRQLHRRRLLPYSCHRQVKRYRRPASRSPLGGTIWMSSLQFQVGSPHHMLICYDCKLNKSTIHVSDDWMEN
jgi:hypothetical protein